MMIPELLAPAGNEKALHAAISAGANAVYLGLDQFNARRNADNFTLDTLEQACDYAHLRGSRVYVTMNTIILPDELDQALECARQAYLRGIDALIVQDIGLASLVARCVPDLRLHISTQMNIHSAYGVDAAAALGAKRITLARELSLPEIDHLADVAHGLGVEIETFGHGALCICYSGQCFMSSMIGGRSANRGLCAQACRLPYKLVDSLDPDHELKSPGEFLLSPKDLCSIDLLPKIAEANVDSIKVEGRMKSAEYVLSVVSVYRSVLDRLEAQSDRLKAQMDKTQMGTSDSQRNVRTTNDGAIAINVRDDERERLASVFSRGFSTAYLTGERGNDMMSYQRPNNRGQFVGRVKTIRDNVAHVSCEIALEPGDLLEFWTRKGNAVFQLPASFEAGRKTVYIPLDEVDTKVQKNDRVFRVRSAAAMFDDDDRKPKIPVMGKAFLRLNEPLKIVFRVATPEEVDRFAGKLASKELSHAISKRLSNCVAVSSSANASSSVDAANRANTGNRTDASNHADAAEFKSEASGVVIEAARSKAICADEVIEHVDRMGSTPFELCHLDVEIDDGVGLGYSQIHRCRTAALEALQEEILSTYRNRELKKAKSIHREKQPRKRLKEDDIKIAVLATNPDCARAAKRVGADSVYVPALNYKYAQTQTAGALDKNPRQAGYPKHCKLIMPVVDHDPISLCESDAGVFAQVTNETANDDSVTKHINGEARIGVDVWDLVHPGDEVVAESLSSLQHALDVEAVTEIGSHLPIVNAASVDIAEAMSAQCIWLSPELNIHQIKELICKSCSAHESDIAHSDGDACISGTRFGITVFGAQELMTTEHCLLMSEGSCSQECSNCARRKKPHTLRDRKGYEFPVVTDVLGRSHLYNSVKLDAVCALEELIDAGVSTFMVDTTLMDTEQAAQATGRLASALKQVLSGKGNVDKLPNTTSGHLFRGVL